MDHQEYVKRRAGDIVMLLKWRRARMVILSSNLSFCVAFGL
jgi:hypothetical protein